MMVLVSKAKVYALPSTGASKVIVLERVVEPFVSTMLVMRLTLPFGNIVDAMVQARPSARAWLLGLPLETSITPKSLLFGRLDRACLEQPANAKVSDTRMISGVWIFISVT